MRLLSSCKKLSSSCNLHRLEIEKNIFWHLLFSGDVHKEIFLVYGVLRYWEISVSRSNRMLVMEDWACGTCGKGKKRKKKVWVTCKGSRRVRIYNVSKKRWLIEGTLLSAGVGRSPASRSAEFLIIPHRCDPVENFCRDAMRGRGVAILSDFGTTEN